MYKVTIKTKTYIVCIEVFKSEPEARAFIFGYRTRNNTVFENASIKLNGKEV